MFPWLDKLSSLTSLVLILLAVKPIHCTEVDFSTITPCARDPCFPYHSSSIGCTGPELTKACFCNALAPINCAKNNCTGNDWYALEDWYSSQCPGEPPLVNMDPGIPLGARKCVRDWIVPARCKASITRNCFCRLANMTDAITSCVLDNTAAVENQAIGMAESFYRDTCVYQEDASGERRPSDGTVQEEVIPSPEKASGQGKDDVMFKVVGGVASFLTVAILAWWFFLGCCCGKSGRQLARRKAHSKLFGEAPPPYTREDMTRARVRG